MPYNSPRAVGRPNLLINKKMALAAVFLAGIASGYAPTRAADAAPYDRVVILGFDGADAA